MSNVEAWIRTVVDHADFAVKLARTLGLGELMPDEIAKVKAALNAKLDEVLPLAIVGVAVAAIGVAAKAEHGIESLHFERIPHCQRCGTVAVQHTEVSPGGTPGTVKLVCSDKACGWSLP